MNIDMLSDKMNNNTCSRYTSVGSKTYQPNSPISYTTIACSPFSVVPATPENFHAVNPSTACEQSLFGEILHNTNREELTDFRDYSIDGCTDSQKHRFTDEDKIWDDFILDVRINCKKHCPIASSEYLQNVQFMNLSEQIENSQTVEPFSETNLQSTSGIISCDELNMIEPEVRHAYEIDLKTGRQTALTKMILRNKLLVKRLLETGSLEEPSYIHEKRPQEPKTKNDLIVAQKRRQLNNISAKKSRSKRRRESLEQEKMIGELQQANDRLIKEIHKLKLEKTNMMEYLGISQKLLTHLLYASTNKSNRTSLNELSQFMDKNGIFPQIGPSSSVKFTYSGDCPHTVTST